MQTVQEAITALHDQNFFVRRAAADKLKQFADAQAVPALIEALLHDEDEWVKIDAAEALGLIGDTRAVPALLTALKSEDLLTWWKTEWDKLETIPDRAQYFKRYFFSMGNVGCRNKRHTNCRR